LYVYTGSATAGAAPSDQHPLEEKIWDVVNGTFVTREQIVPELVQSDYVLLGETHDNPLHHEYQAWSMQQLLKAGQRPGVAFEMISESQYRLLQQTTISSADQFFDVVKWEQSGWPEREIYRPVYDTVIDAGLDIFPANIERKQLRQAIQNAHDETTATARDLMDEVLLDADETEEMRQEIAESHCNMLPEKHIDSMVTGQRIRDAIMALSMMNNRADDSMVLIAGKGHTRRDRGVPAYIHARAPDAVIVSIGWHEVTEELTTPQQYIELWGDSRPFDYIWFTIRVDRPDPCEQFKKQHDTTKET
jgi:uncharacterized iron-regulated protein